MSPDCSLEERGVRDHGLWHHPIHHPARGQQAGWFGEWNMGSIAGAWRGLWVEQGGKACKGVC